MPTALTNQQNHPSAKVQLPKQQGERKGFTNQEIQTIEADRKEPEKWNVVHLREMDFSRPDKVVRTVNSYLGILRQTASYRLRCELFFRPEYLRIGYFDADMTRMQRAA